MPQELVTITGFHFMKWLTLVIHRYDGWILSPLIVVLAMGLASLSVPVSAQNNASEGLSPAQTEMVSNYEAAKAAGRHA